MNYRPKLKNAILEIILHLSLMLAGIYLSKLSLPFWAIGQLIIGISFWKAFVIIHACGHHAFSGMKKLDDFIGFLNSPFTFVPYYSWKYIHNDHHRWTGWQDLDPTMQGLSKKPPPMILKILNLCWKFWIPIISLHYIVTVFFNPLAPSIKTKKRIASILSMIFIITVHVALLTWQEMNYFRLFALSSFVYLNMADISLLTQHVHLPMDHSGSRKVMPKMPSEQDQFSHTVLFPHFFARWILGNFNHHSLHHAHPKLPYYT